MRGPGGSETEVGVISLGMYWSGQHEVKQSSEGAVRMIKMEKMTRRQWLEIRRAV